MRRTIVGLLMLLACAPGMTAEGAYEPGAVLVSASPERREQGDGPTLQVDISDDGRYVVFQTRARNFFADDDPDLPGAFREGGVFRRDLTTGALELVAYGDVRPTSSGSLTIGARNPSISADGRWVAFSTAAPLAAADTNTKVDVYVRDMSVAVGDPAAYELISARDGGDTPATYGFPTNPTGAEATAGAAISADGRMVVFRTRAPSDLPAADSATVPLGQVFVRDRETRTTTLVTRRMDDGSPAGGADAAAAPAGISADGSTVVWAGTNGPAQTVFLPGEEDQGFTYYLWRRVADGPDAPTRRITGISDPDDPACPPGSLVQTGDQTTTGPCWGPLALPEGIPLAGSIADKLPALSADGRKAAFLTGPFPRPSPVSGNQLDVYVTDMSAGMSRKAGTLELTQESQQDINSVQAVAISPDGHRIAFVTSRTTFSLPSPRLLTPRPPTAGEAELYVVDLRTMDMERVTQSFDEGEIDGSVLGGVGTIAMSRDGSRVAVAATASNLFFGDSNGVADAFVLSEVDPNAAALRAAAEPPFAEIGPPAEEETKAAPSLGLRVRRKGKSLCVTVSVPAAGRVAAQINARLRRGAKTRRIARARRRPPAAGRITLTLRPAARYRRALRRERMSRARVVVTFTPVTGAARITAGRTVSLRD